LYPVRNHQANSHAKKGWEQFTDAVINTISQKKEGVVFLLWGNSAQEKSRYYHLAGLVSYEITKEKVLLSLSLFLVIHTREHPHT
jgi:uracil DNA glycosylase